MNKHPTPMNIRIKRRQEIVSNKNTYQVKHPELALFLTSSFLLQGYFWRLQSYTETSVTLEICNHDWYDLPRFSVTVARHKYLTMAAARKIIKQDKLVWQAADKMCEVLGLYPITHGMYPFGSQMHPTGVMGMGNGAYIGAVPPETRPMRYWMYKHALAIKAANDVFNGVN